MDQRRFRGYVIKGSGHHHIDYEKALGGRRIWEIKIIVEKEIINHAHARIEK